MNPFNPYREWLELDPTFTKPNLYQLFGIDVFEEDETKISHAADKSISKVRSCRPGSYARQWSELLDELTAAKRLLLNRGEKANYDHDLRQTISGGAPSSSNEPVMHVEGVTHADPSFTRNFYPPNTHVPVQPVPVNPTSGEQPSSTDSTPPTEQPTTPIAPSAPAANPMTPAAQAPYRPAVPVPPATSAAQAPYQPTQHTPHSAPQAMAAQQPYQPGAPLAIAAAAMPAASPASPFAQPYQPQSVGAPLAQPASAIPAATVAATNPLAPVAAAAPAVPAVPLAQPAGAPATPTPQAYQATAVPTHEPATASATPKVGGSGSVANQQRSRGKGAAVALPFLVIGIASVLLLGGLLYVGLSQPAEETVVQSPTTSRPVIVPATPTTTPPLMRPPRDVSNPVATSIPTRDVPAPTAVDAGDVSIPNPFPDVPETNPFDTPDGSALPPDRTVAMKPDADLPEVAPEPPTPPDMPAVPETPQPTKAELAELGKLLSNARTAIGEKDFALADTHLAKAEGIAKLPEHRGMVGRLKQLNQYAREYWDVVYQAMDEFEGGEELPYRNSVIVIVEKSKTQLMIRYKGINRAYPVDNLPAGIAMAIADHWFDETEPSNLVFKGAWGFVMPSASEAEREKAMGWWREAVEQGVDIKEFMKIVDDNYDLAVSS